MRQAPHEQGEAAMSFYDYILGIDIRTVNMDRMMRRFGVDQALDAQPPIMRVHAVERCRACGRQEDCRAWLDAAVDADVPPSYCRNGQLIDDLSHHRPAR
jgi:hypothetical protein